MGMRKVLFLVTLVLGSFVLAAPARAETVQVRMTFAERFCGEGPVACGRGEVFPLGQATETIEFGAGCGGNCDLRTITLEGGTIVAEETLVDGHCPGSCNAHAGFPFSGTLDDVIIGGTGDFEGATGHLTGTVRAAGGGAQIKLSGPISFGS
jgi:hypothetical protein